MDAIKKSPDGTNNLIKHPDDIAPNSSWKRITVEHIRSGQPRPYADSVYEAIITIEGGIPSSQKGYDLRWRGQESTIKEIAKMFVRNFADTPTPFQTGLTEIEMIEETDFCRRWRVVIVEPYTD